MKLTLFAILVLLGAIIIYSIGYYNNHQRVCTAKVKTMDDGTTLTTYNYETSIGAGKLTSIDHSGKPSTTFIYSTAGQILQTNPSIKYYTGPSGYPDHDDNSLGIFEYDNDGYQVKATYTSQNYIDAREIINGNCTTEWAINLKGDTTATYKTVYTNYCSTFDAMGILGKSYRNWPDQTIGTDASGATIFTTKFTYVVVSSIFSFYKGRVISQTRNTTTTSSNPPVTLTFTYY